MNSLLPGLQQLAIAGEEERKRQAEEAKRRTAAAQSPTAAPSRQTSELVRIVGAVRERDMQEAEARKPRPAPQLETQSQVIDAAYAEQLGRRLLGACSEAVAKVQGKAHNQS